MPTYNQSADLSCCLIKISHAENTLFINNNTNIKNVPAPGNLHLIFEIPK